MNTTVTTNRPRWTRALLLAAVACLPTSADAQWKPQMGLPLDDWSMDVWPRTAGLSYAELELRGSARYSAAEQKLTVSWRYKSTCASNSQELPLGYWPTALSGTQSADGLVIAGKRANGNTVIELWTAGQPPLAVLGPDTARSASIGNARISKTLTLYDEATEGRDIAMRLLHKVDEPTAILAQFHDSNAIYNIDFCGPRPVTTLVASAKTHPMLATKFTTWWARSHCGKGYVYVFGSEHVANSTLVLIDANRDHVIDTITPVSDAEWMDPQWSDGSSYAP